jgi:hypothetical protein
MTAVRVPGHLAGPGLHGRALDPRLAPVNTLARTLAVADAAISSIFGARQIVTCQYVYLNGRFRCGLLAC